MSKDLCTTCTKRPNCTSLCPEAEAYANQDAGKYHEPGDTHFTATEREILKRFARGESREKIRKSLGITPLALRLHIHRLKTKRFNIDI